MIHMHIMFVGYFHTVLLHILMIYVWYIHVHMLIMVTRYILAHMLLLTVEYIHVCILISRETVERSMLSLHHFVYLPVNCYHPQIYLFMLNLLFPSFYILWFFNVLNVAWMSYDLNTHKPLMFLVLAWPSHGICFKCKWSLSCKDGYSWESVLTCSSVIHFKSCLQNKVSVKLNCILNLMFRICSSG